MALRKNICKRIMKMFPSYPDPQNPHLSEVFKTNEYIYGSDEHQKSIRYSSSFADYNWEYDSKISWMEKYFFPRISPKDLKNKILLDLGSYTGGRITAWTKKYKLSKGLGLDTDSVFKLASEEFSNSLNINNVYFETGVGENLPYANNSIDFIVSTDVFEHVQDLEKVLNECYRVLKDGGKLLIAFPQYLQPLEAHLGKVTNAIALHWFFSSEIITAAYNEIIEERKPNSYWYKPISYPLRSWEKLFSLNGTSIKSFKKLIKHQYWVSRNFKVQPIFSDGRKSELFKFKILSRITFPLAHIPIIDEFFLGRINCILTK